MNTKSPVLYLLTMIMLVASIIPQAAMAQEPDVEINSTSENSAVEADISEGEINEKGDFTEGESSGIDPGNTNIRLPFIVTDNDTTEINAASVPSAYWRTVFHDQLCGFPNSWYRNDYNATGHYWRYTTVNGWCAAQPNSYSNKMNVSMTRSFSLAGARAARLKFSFKMDTEYKYDYLLYEYSCNGETWQGNGIHARSGYYMNSWRYISIPLGCLGDSSVQVRFTFQSDRSVTDLFAPAIDYVTVEKYQ